MIAQNFFVSFTRRIHSRFRETGYERAKMLYNSCSDVLSRTRGNLYLDIGTYTSHNAAVFKDNFSDIVAIDLGIPPSNILKESSKAHLLEADGLKLPFDTSQFDFVSLFSVIEHVSDPQLLLEEVFRVLRNQGTLIIQIPNRFFPIELHSGIPFFFYFPKKIRKLITIRSNLSWMEEVDIPDIKNLIRMISNVEPQACVIVRKITYDQSITIPETRLLYDFISRIGLFKVFPMGYLVLVSKSSKK
jgi:SAM-dependent methyltransferase